MYHTFQAGAVAATTEGDDGRLSRSAGSRRISTSNACVECRRRKIRCDGVQPCGQCQWYQHPEMCHYAKPTQRVVPSRKLVDKLQSQVDQYHSVFARLFPGQGIKEFLSLPRAELVNLAITLPSPNNSPDNRTASTNSISSTEHCRSETIESLEALEQAPEQDSASDESKRLKDKVQAISDDVNGLSLAFDRPSSYIGISSVNAAMKVIYKISPLVKHLTSNISTDPVAPSRSSTPPCFILNTDPHSMPAAQLGETLVDSYFAHVHCLMPMVDEQQFRNTYQYSSRRDSPWLALLNMVFALGSLAGSTCNDEDHMVYYHRARKHLEVETFGSGSLYVVQALGLLSGYYLHWLNRPNEANGLMGATLRMATAHGLHREYSDSVRVPGGSVSGSNLEVPAETRRRTWWSIYCLDSWATLTTGRPSLGRTGIGITVQNPRIPHDMNNAQYLESLRLLPLIHFIGFCKIATRVQDLLAQHSMIAIHDLFILDAELDKWHQELPPILKDVLPRTETKQGASSARARTQSVSSSISGRPPVSSASDENPFEVSRPPERRRTACPEALKTPRTIMHWRYQNLRMLMHRPILLATALNRTPFAKLSPEEKLAVSRCRIIAGDTIEDIDATCQENLIAGWNAVWMMYQAVMVPLVSLFSVLTNLSTSDHGSPPSTPGRNGSCSAERGTDDDVEAWRREIEKAIAFFDRMHPWSVAAKKSKHVVQRLYDATIYVGQQPVQQRQQQQQQHSSLPHDNKTFGQPHPIHPQPFPSTTMSMLDSGVDIRDMALCTSAQMPMRDYASIPSDEDWNMQLGGEAVANGLWNEMMWETLSPSDVPDQPDMFPNMLQHGPWWQGTTEQQGLSVSQWQNSDV